MDLRRLGFVSLWVLCVVSSAAAAPMDIAVLFDSDDNQFTGCAVSGMQGVDHVFTTHFDTAAPAHVTGIFGQRCADGALGSPIMVDAGGWPALWNETTGELSLETRFPIDFFQPRPGARMRVGIVAHSGSSEAILLLQDDGGPIILPGTPPKRRAVTTPGRAISPDGSAADWSAMVPLAIGDAGSPALRLVAVYGFTAGPNIFFRFVAQASSNAPTAADDQYSTTPGTPLTVATPGILANDTDPRSLPLTAALVGDVNHGTLVLNADGSFSYTDGGSGQRDHFTYRASNGEQQSNIARVDIGIGAQPNRPPVTGDDAYQVPLGGTLTVIPPGVLGNDSDPDLDPLQAVLQTGAAAGTVTLNPNGSFTYVHGGANSSPDSFTYHATDGVETSRQTTVHISVRANEPPAAEDDAYVVSEGAFLTIAAPGLLANDTDPDGGTLTTSAVSQPAHGTLTLGTDGSFTYLHDGSETTSDEFTYQISDGAATAVAIVRFTVLAADDAPVAANDSYTVAEDGTLSVPAPGVLGNDTDIDSAVSQAILASSTANGALTLNANGSFTYTPNANFYGTDSFTYRAGDGTNTSANAATVTITVTAVNDLPSFAAGANVTVAEDSGAYSAGWASAISAGPANESTQTLTFTASNDNNALFSVQPAIAPNGTLTFTPATNANGTTTVTVTMSDNGAPVQTTAPVMFTITVTAVNDMPTFTAGPGVTVLEDSAAYNAAWATAISAGPTDETAQTVTFVATNGNNGLFSVQPAVSPTGALTFTPAPNANGSATVTVTATDNGTPAASSAAQTFTITVTPVNDVPSFTSGGNVTGIEDTAYNAAWTTVMSAGPADESAQTMAFGATNDNNALFATQPAIGPTGVLSFTPAPNANGSATVTVTIQDNGGTANGGADTSAPQVFTITVTAVNDAPSFTKGANQTATDTAGAQNVPGWATTLSAGPADETAQALDFLVTNDNSAAFNVQPAVAPDGTLTFTPAPGATGVVTVTVRIHDNGGTANGGVDTSAPQTFTITIHQLPAITSANTTTFTIGIPGVFTVTTTGFPTPAVSGSVLPSALTFVDNGNGTGTLSGTAGAGTAGAHAVTFTATNVVGATPQAFTLNIMCPTITITNPANATATASAAFSETFTQAGGVGTMTFTTASALPAGLTLAANGVLSGTPTETGTFAIVVTATDSNGCSGVSATYNLVVACQNITVTNPAVSTGTVSTFFSQAFTQGGAIGTPTFTTASTLPSGLALAADGTLSGTPTQPGTFPIVVTVTDSNGCTGTSATYNLIIACQTITVTNPANTSSPAGSALNETFTQSGAIGTATFTTASTLPAGVTLSTAGLLSGTPTGNGTFNIDVTVTDSNGCTGANLTYVLTITCQTITVTNPANTTGTAGSAFTALFTQSGGLGTVTFTTSSTLPAGLALAGNGVLSGTPTETGTFNIVVTATDQNLCTGTSATYTLVIGCPTITVSNPANSNGTASTLFTETFTQTGAVGTAVFTTASTLPAGVTLATNGVLSGTPTQTGTFPIVVTVTDSASCTGTSATYTLVIACQTISVTNPANSNGIANSAFLETFTQTAAIGTASFTTASVLPAGLTLGTNGVLSGTPMQTGTFPITVTVTDSNGCTGTSAVYNLVIGCQVITVNSPANTGGTISASFSETFTQAGAIGGATFTTASTLPAGLTLAANGVLSGTPTEDGTFPIVVVVTDGNLCTGTSATYNLVIACQTITVTNPTGTGGTVGAPFSETFQQTGAIGGATFTTASTLPAGITLAANGVLSGTPTQSGNFPIVVTVTDGGGCTGTSATYNLTIVCQTITVTNPLLTSSPSGAAINETFTQSGAIGAATFTTASTLPAGLTLGANGALSGTPTQSGTFNIDVTVTDSNNCTGVNTTYVLTITCPVVTTARSGGGLFPAGTIGSAYAGQSFTATGGQTPYTFAVTAGTFPTSLTLATDGTVGGSPTATGTFNFTVTATDANGCTGATAFSIAIQPAAIADAFNNLVNNTQAYVSGGATTAPLTPAVQLTGSIITNDLPAGNVTITPGTFATTQGGSVTIAVDGTFVYTPPVTVNALASDTFTYTIASDTAGTGTPTAANGTVTLNLAGRVWYVKNDATAGGNGQSQSPFNSLASFTTAPRVGPDQAGDIIYVYRGDGTTTNLNTGIALLDNEQLVGEGVALVVGIHTLVPAGASPQITKPAASVVTLGNGNTVRGITATGGTVGIHANTITNFTGDTLVITNNTFNGIFIDNSAGTATITNSTLTNNGAAGIAGLSVNFGTAAVTFDSTNTIDAPVGVNAVSVSNHSTGAVQIGAAITGGGRISIANNTGTSTITFSGTMSLNPAAQNAVSISGNSAGTTMNFAGPMTITNTTGTAFLASGSGTLNVTGAVTATTSAGAVDIISINGLTVGAGGVTFASVNNSGSGVTSAIKLTNVVGLVTVNGGTMSNGVNAVTLEGSSTSLTLSNVTINGNYATGVRNPAATNFGTLTLSNTSIGAGTAVDLRNGTLIASGSTLNGNAQGILLDSVVIGAGGATFISTSGNGGAFGASLTNVTGQPLNLGTGQLIHNSNTNFLVSGGTAAISYAGNLFNNNARFLVDINNHATGAITLSGELGIAASPSNVAGTGIRVQNSSGTITFSGTKTFGAATGRMASPAVQLLTNPGATFNFSGTTTIFTAGFTAFTADAGTINFGGTNSINSQGSALVLSNVALSAGTFSNITSTGGVNGISLTTVTGGPLTISAGALSGATGATFLVSGGTVGVSYAGSITHGAAAQAAVSVTNHTTGTIGFSGSISTTNGTGLQFNNADGVYPFSGTATINGGTAGVSINTGSAGTFTFATGTQIGNSTSPSGVAFDINNAGATTNVTYNGTINTTLNRPVSVQNVGANSTISFTGNVTSTNNGILLATMGNPTSVTFSGLSKSLSVGANTAVSMTGVAGNTVTFSNGGLVITRTTGAGIVATGGGTLIVTRNAGTANTIGNGTAGTALSLTNVSIGTGGLVFESISQNGGSNGIFLQNTGATAGLTIAGTGSAGSGGTIQNTSGADGATAGCGIYLDNTRAVSLTSMQLNGHSNFAIRGNLVVGFTLTNSTINGTNGSSAATDDASIRFTDLTGTASITGCNISGGHEDNLAVINNSGTLDRITVSNTTFGANSTLEGNDAILLQADGTATIKATVNNSTFTSSRGDQFQFSVRTSGANDLIFTTNNLTNNHPNIVSGGGCFSVTSSMANPFLTFNISDNTIRDCVGSALIVGNDGTANGVFSGTIDNNVIGDASGAVRGSTQGSGIVVGMIGTGGAANTSVTTVNITNNEIYDFTNYGILTQTELGGELISVVQGNTIAQVHPNAAISLFPTSGIRMVYGTNSLGGGWKGCLTIGHPTTAALKNTVSGTGTNGGPEMRIFPRFTSVVGVLGGYTGTATDSTSWLLATNVTTTPNGARGNTATYQSTCP